MANLYDVLFDLCEKAGITGYKMCNDLGLSKSLMTELKMGRKKGINAETAEKIASYFDVSVGYLLGKEEQKEKAPAKAEADEDPLSQVSFALFGTHEEIDEDILSDVREFARFKLEQKRKAAEEKK